MKIVTVLGARPQFIKAAPVSRALKDDFHEFILHTGQHYDYDMSEIFFEELGLSEPNVNLGIQASSHGEQTGKMLAGIERVLLKEEPAAVLVYGDTNSTLAGALAAVKLHVPVFHVEAGLRSFNKTMPEEINRILTDQVADLLFCPTPTAVKNLNTEGIEDGVFLTGDVMYDAVVYNADLAVLKSDVIKKLDLKEKNYYLATVHRPANTDNATDLGNIFQAFGSLALDVILPLHPRTRGVLKQAKINVPENVQIIDPVGYLDMLVLEKNARVIITDSGGIQKEAYIFGVSCVTLRQDTEWWETVDVGWNKLVGADPDQIIQAVNSEKLIEERPNLFGDGKAAQKIVNLIKKEYIG
jgi:UDP-N-acetylglucosamine 2-epimerase